MFRLTLLYVFRLIDDAKIYLFFLNPKFSHNFFTFFNYFLLFTFDSECFCKCLLKSALTSFIVRLSLGT